MGIGECPCTEQYLWGCKIRDVPYSRCKKNIDYIYDIFFGMNIKHILHIGYHQIPYIATALGTIILYYYLYQATSSFSAVLEQSTSRSFWYSSKSSQLCAKVFTKKALQAAGRNVPRMLHGRYEVPSGKLPVCSGKSPSFI